ncbi:MAG: hypothetical protein ACLT8E_07070 [Akkermansia sp.]
MQTAVENTCWTTATFRSLERTGNGQAARKDGQYYMTAVDDDSHEHPKANYMDRGDEDGAESQKRPISIRRLRMWKALPACFLKAAAVWA